MIAVIQQVNIYYYSLALIAILLSMLFYSLTWQYLLNFLSIKTTFQKTFLFTWIGTFVDILVPAESISGDITRAYLMSKSSNENAGRVMASVIGHRILNLIITLVGLAVGSTFFILKYSPSEFIVKFLLIVTLGTAASLILFFVLCLRKEVTEKIVNWLVGMLAYISRGRWKEAQLKSKAQEMLKAFHQGISILGKHSKNLGLPIISTVIAWFFDLLTAFLVFISIGFEISLIAILVVYFISYAIQTIPLGIPAEVGLTEIVMTNVYTLLGVPLTISAIATVLTRLLSVWFKFFIGYLATQWIGIKVLEGLKV
jgi:uncharacterized protein (TIRG00374 family)